MKIMILFTIYVCSYKYIVIMPNNIKSESEEYIIVKENLKVEEKYISFESSKFLKKYKFIYFFKQEKSEEEIDEIKQEINYGYIYKIKIGEVEEIENSFNNKDSFDYENYMLSKKITDQVLIEKAEYINSKNNIVYKLKNYRKNLLLKIEKKYPKNYEIISSLVLGEKIEDQQLKENIKNVGIIQLFTISGLHINFIIESIEYVLKKMKIKRKNIDLIIVLILPIYGVLANMGVSIKRAIEMKYLEVYYKYKNKEMDKINILFFILIFNIILNPYNLLNIGFIFSYFITMFLILNKWVLQNIKSGILRNYVITSFVLPISINLNNKFNFLIFFSLKYYDLLVKYLLVNSFIMIIFINIDYINIVAKLILNILVVFLNILNVINLIFVIKIGQIDFYFIIIYYVYYYKFLKEMYLYKGNRVKYREILILIIFIFILNINVIGEVHIIDVGQGDSILIKYPLNGQKILIDTGDKVADEEIVDYLLSEGIREIDYLIITHNHSDHNANLDAIMTNFKVKNLVINNYYYEDENEYFKGSEFENTNIINISTFTRLPIGYVYVSSNKDEEENNNSIVFYTQLGFNKWLFMGDAEKEVENEILEKYNLDIDYIKLGHHGSSTSSTEELLKETTPKEAYICSGKDNQYGHPDEEVIKRLEDNNIKYRNTQDEGEIVKYFI